LCHSASRVKLIHGLSSTIKVEDLWTTRLGTAYCHGTPSSLIVVVLCALQNSSHLLTAVRWHKPHISSTLTGSYGLAITAVAATELANGFLDECSQKTPTRSVLRAGVCVGMGNGDAKGFVLA
jgi:hypothetical protein